MILILGNTDAIIKVEFSLYHCKERNFARNNAWNTRIADKNLILLDEQWNSTENEKLKKCFP